MDEVKNMQTRADDTPVAGITIDRRIPLSGLITIGVAIIGQAILLWAGAREAAIEQKHMSNRVAEMTLAIKEMSVQMSTKDRKDDSQDYAIESLRARVERLEVRK